MLLYCVCYGIITVPAPIMNITTNDDMVFGEPLQLDCTVTAARGVTSDVNFRWFAINNLLKTTRVRTVTVAGKISGNSVLYEDSLLFPSLNTTNRLNVYRCDAFIYSNIQVVNGSGHIELDFEGNKFMHTITYEYLLSNCIRFLLI